MVTDQSQVPVEPSGCPDGDPQAWREQVIERVRFVFRNAGANRPARELEQMILLYRLEDRQS